MYVCEERRKTISDLVLAHFYMYVVNEEMGGVTTIGSLLRTYVYVCGGRKKTYNLQKFVFAD